VTISPQTRNWLRQSAALDGAVVSQTLLNLLERVEALEAAQPHDILLIGGPAIKADTVATDEELYQLAYSMPLSTEQGRLRRCYDLGRQHGATQSPVAQPAPVAREVHFEFAVVDGDYNQQAGGTAPTYSQALSEGNHYLAQYLQDGPHTLEIRRIELLTQAEEVSHLERNA